MYLMFVVLSSTLCDGYIVGHGAQNVMCQRVKSHYGPNDNYQQRLITTTVCNKNMLLPLFIFSETIIPEYCG